MLSLPGRTSLTVWPIVILSLCARATGEEIKPRVTFKEQKDFVYCVAVSPDGKSLASGARDGVVVCWDVDTKRPTWIVNAHKDDGNGYTHAMSVAFSPDGKTLASGGWDCTVRLWEAVSGAPKQTFTHENLVYSVAFSPDGKILASAENNSGTIHLWNVATGKSTGMLADGRGSASSVAFFPDGKTLASGSYVVGGENRGGVVRLWDLSQRKLALEIPAQPTYKVAVSPDGRLVAGTGYKRRPSGNLSDGVVRLWDTRTGQVQRTWFIVGDGQTSISPVAFSPDGRLVAGGSMMGERVRKRKPGEIFLWDVESSRLVWRQACHDDDVTCLAFAPDGKTLISGGRDHAVKLWEITGRMMRTSK